MFINRWKDKEDVVLVQRHNRLLLSHKEEWNNAICSNMGGPEGYYAKWNKSEREWYSMTVLIHGI